MNTKIWLKLLVVATMLVAGTTLFARDVAGQNPDSFPVIPALYEGTVTVENGEVADGLSLKAKIENIYESDAVAVEDGNYKLLLIQPPDASYQGLTITFHLDGIQADETLPFRSGAIELKFNLTFPRLPPPTPTPTPVVVAPAIYSGTITLEGAQVPQGSRLTAQVGAYESSRALITNGMFGSLVVAPNEESFVGMPIKFFLDGYPSTPMSEVFEPGEFKVVSLVFMGYPTPTATFTPIAPTATPVPELAIPPVPSSPVVVVVTATPEPTKTSGPPSPVVVVVTATPEPEMEGGGLCSAPSRSTPISRGLGNLVVLLGPLAAVVGYRKFRR